MTDLIQTIQFRIEELQAELAKTKDKRKKEFLERTISTNLKILLAIKPIGKHH